MLLNGADDHLIASFVVLPPNVPLIGTLGVTELSHEGHVGWAHVNV